MQGQKKTCKYRDRVFRYKNAIINKIEQSEGFADCESLEKMIKDLGYNQNYVVEYTTTDRGTIYKVEIYIIFNLPLVKTKVTIPVRGETRLIDTTFNQQAIKDATCKR